MIRVVVPGAAGRMGRMVLDAIAERPGLRLTAAVERPGHAAVGSQAAGAILVTDDLAAAFQEADAYVDFTAPEATARNVTLAAERNVAAVIGTTGLGAEARQAILRAAERVPIVVSPNFSLGVNLLLGLVEQVARLLGEEYDGEVVELHHRAKRDAPSGTALAIAEALARGRGRDLTEVKRTVRDGDVGPRPAGEIGVLAVRGGDVVGEHTAYFFGPAERLELTHRATSRSIFARGAVRAAEWVVGQHPGVYSMRDVLGM